MKYTSVPSFKFHFVIWSRELFGKWRHDLLAKGKAHKAAWLHDNYLGLMVPCLWQTTMYARVWYWTNQKSGNLIGSESGLSFVYLQSLLIHFTNVCVNIYVIWNRKLITSQWATEKTSSINFFNFFLFHDPRVSTRGIASIFYLIIYVTEMAHMVETVRCGRQRSPFPEK